MTNVCFLLGSFQINGGIGRVTSILSNELARDKDIAVIAIEYVRNPEKDDLYRLKDGIKTYALYGTQIPMTTALLRQHAVQSVRRILKENDIDVLIACGALFFPLGVASTLGLRTRCFCWEHINPAINSDYRFQGVCRSIGARFSDKVIVLTKSAERYYLEKLNIPARRVLQIYNPIDSVVNKRPYDEQSKKILSVGRLCEQKDFSTLIQVAKLVLPRHPEWSWDIYGQGELYEKLMSEIRDVGLSGQLSLMGQVDDLYSRYQDYSFMVMTSLYEGFPMSLLEGAAHSLPLVCFDIQTGPDEIIDDGHNGYLISPRDAERMAEAVNSLIEGRQVRIRMAAASLESSERFSLEECLNKWKQALC